MASADTTREADRHQAAVFAGLTGPERVAMAVQMAEEAKSVTLAGIRARHPDYGDDDVAREWLRLLHGDEVARLVG